MARGAASEETQPDGHRVSASEGDDAAVHATAMGEEMSLLTPDPGVSFPPSHPFRKPVSDTEVGPPWACVRLFQNF